jgi:hypothetical protein
LSQSTFDEVNVDYQMIDGVCYVNGEQLVSHLKGCVAAGVDDVYRLVTSRLLDDVSYMVAESAITGMAGVGMWIEECVIEATQEKFREALDKEWPSL